MIVFQQPLKILLLGAIAWAQQQQAGLDLAYYTSDGHVGVTYQMFGYGSYVITANMDSTVKVWSAADGSHRMTIQAHDQGVLGAMVAPDGFLWTFGEDGNMKKWDFESGQRLNTWPVFYRPYRMHYHNSSRIIILGLGGDIGELNPQTGAVSLWNNFGYGLSLAVAGDQVFAGGSNTIRIYSLSTCQYIRAISLSQTAYDMLVYALNNTLIVSGESSIEFYSLPSMVRYRNVIRYQNWPRMTLDGQKLLSASTVGLFVWNFATSTGTMLLSNRYLFAVTVHQNATFIFGYEMSLQKLDSNYQVVWSTEVGTKFYSVVIDSSTRKMYTGTGGGEIWEWQQNPSMLLRKLSVTTVPVTKMIINKGSIYAFTGYGNVFKVSITSGAVTSLINPALYDSAGTVIPSAGLLITSHMENGLLKIRNMTTLELIREVKASGGRIMDIFYDDTAFYTCTGPGMIDKWTLNGTWLWSSLSVGNGIRITQSVSVASGYAFSVYTSPCVLLQIDSTTGANIRSIVHNSGICSVLATSDYVFMSYCTFDAPVFQYRFSATELTHVRNLTGHTNGVSMIIRDGPYIITTSSDSSIRRWFIPELVQVSTTPISKTLAAQQPQRTETASDTTPAEDGTTKSVAQQPSDTSALGQMLTFGFTGALTAVVFASGCCIWYLKKRQLRTYQHLLSTKPYTTTSDTTSVFTTIKAEITSDTAQLQTLVTQSYGRELSIPAYLQLDFGLDFVLSDFVAAGGNGALFECIPTSYNLKTRVQKYFVSIASQKTSDVLNTRFSGFSGVSSDESLLDRPIKLIAKCMTTNDGNFQHQHQGRKFLAVEQLSDRSRIAMFQELSLMNILSSFNARAESDTGAKTRELFVHLFGFSVRPMAFVMRRYELGDLDGFCLLSGQRWNDRYRLIFSTNIPGSGPPNIAYSKRNLINVLMDLCEALKIMHTLEVAHCDVKPSNVLLTYSVNYEHIEIHGVMADFGIARVLSEKNGIQKVDAFEVSDMRGLSAAYAAPDVWFRFRNRLSAEKSNWFAGDVYAVGVTIHSLLTRQMPFMK